VQVERSAFFGSRAQDRSVALRPRPLSSSIGALLVAVAALSGCATPATQEAGTAVAAVQSTQNLLSAAGDAVTTAVMPQPTKGPALLRTQMEQQAGPSHFKNEQFVYGHDKLRATHTPFEEHRAKFVSSVFVSSREKFRGGKTQPTPGPVIGPAVGDSAATLAALAAAQAGIPLPLAQPLLAQLLPGFGY
jgi:hypothetical protein